MPLEQIGLQAVLQGGSQYVSDLQKAEAAEKAMGTAATQAATVTTKAGKEIEGGFTGVRKVLGDLLSTVGSIAPQLAGVGVAFAGAFALKDAVSSVMNLGSEVKGLQRIIGGTPEEVSRLIFAFGSAGVGADTLTSNLTRFSKRLQGLQDDEDETGAKSSALKDEFNKLGIAVVDSTGKALPMKEVIYNVADAIQKLGPGTEASTLAIDAFGRAGTAMLPALLKGRDGIIELEKESDKLGHTMTEQELGAFSRYKLATRQLGEAFEGLKLTIGGTLLPVMADTAVAVTTVVQGIIIRLIPAVKEAASWIGDTLTEAWNAIGPAVTNVTSQFTLLAGLVQDNLLPPVKDFFELIDGKEVLLSALAGVVGGALTLAVGSLITTVQDATDVLGALFTVMAANPFVLFVAATAALGVAIYELVKYWDDLKERFPILIPLMEDVESLFKQLKVAVQDLPTYLSAVGAAFWDVFGGDIVGAIQSMVDGLRGLVSFLSDDLPGAISTAAGFISDFGEGVGTAFSTAGEFAQDFGNTLAEGFGIAADGASGLVDVISTAMSGIVDIVSTAAQEVYELLSYLNPFAEHSESLVSAVQRGVDVIIAAYNSVPDAMDQMRQKTEELVTEQADLDTAIGQSTALIDAYKVSIKGAQDTLNSLKSANIAEEAPFTQQAKDLERQQDELKLKIAQAKLSGPLTQQVVDKVDPKTGKVTMKTADTAVGTQVKDLEDQLAKLGLQATALSLEDKLKFGPMKDDIKALTDETKTLPFADIVDGIKTSKTAIDSLTPAQKAEEDRLKALQDQLKASKDTLDLYNKAITQMQKAQDDAAKAAKGSAGGGAASKVGFGSGLPGASDAESPTAGIKKSIDNAKESLMDAKKVFEDWQERFKDFKQSISDAMDTVKDLFNLIKKDGAKVWDRMGDGLTVISDLVQGSIPTIEEYWGIISDGAATAAEAVSGAFGPVMDFLAKQWEKFVNDVLPALDNVTKPIQIALAVIWNVFKENWDKILAVVVDVLKLMGDNLATGFTLIKDIISVALALLRGDWSGAWNGMKTLVKDAIEGAAKLIPDAWKLLTDAIALALGALGTSWGIAWGLIKDAAIKIFDSLPEPIQKILDAIGTAVSVWGTLVKDYFDTAWKLVRDAFNIFKDLFTGDWGALKKDVLKFATDIKDGAVKAIGDLIDGITNLVPKMLSAATSVGGAIMDGIKAGVSAVGGIAMDIGETIVKAVKSLVNSQVIDRINSALEFEMTMPGALPNFHVNPPDVPHLRKGGWVPGYGSGDTVLSLLEPGEFVIPKDIAGQYRAALSGGISVGARMALSAAGSGRSGGNTSMSIDLRNSSFTGSPQENAQAIEASVKRVLKKTFGRDAFLAGAA